MRARPKNVLILLGVVCFIPIFWISLSTKQDESYEKLLEKRFAVLQEKLQHAEFVSQQRENDLHVMHSQFNHVVQLLVQNNISHRMNSRYSTPDALVDFQNLSNISQTSLHLPSLFTYLPHIIGKPESLKPKYTLSKNKFSASIVIGIPTIKREGVSYLNQTLTSLITGLTDEEKRDCLIVVFVSEPNDYEYVSKVGREIHHGFTEYVESGLVEVISPSDEFYPNMKHLKSTYGDNEERVRWRTKQNLDFSFLMLYARNRGVYYVQLEDDVISKPGYFSIMKTYAERQTGDDWILLEFSTLGFIGKMFKSSKLPMIVEFFLMFYKDKPIDWLLDYLLSVKICNPEKDAKHCQRMKAELRRRYKPSLFQHIGMQSSLKGKLQKLKDKDFGKQMLHRAHVNPSAELKTSLKPYQKFKIQKAYIGEDIFWATSPVKGDYILVTFTPPIELDGFLIRSGNKEHPSDKFYNSVVDISPAVTLKGEAASLYNSTNDGFYTVSEFDKNGLVDVSLKDDIGKIKALRVRVLDTSDFWVLISEIHIREKTKKKS